MWSKRKTRSRRSRRSSRVGRVATLAGTILDVDSSGAPCTVATLAGYYDPQVRQPIVTWRPKRDDHAGTNP